MSTLQVKELTVGYGSKTVIKDMNLMIPEGKITVFIGGNGCGKSTLLRTLARLQKPDTGAVLLDGRQIAQMSTREVAKSLSILPQGSSAPEGLTVRQLVRQGRYPHQSWLKQWSSIDEEIVNVALQSTRVKAFADQTVDSLSGGQRQRVWIAMTLAQGTGMLLLDEPTTYLDLSHQVEILDMLYELNERDQRTIVMVLHDLNLACRYAHYMVAVSEGNIYASGAPEEIVTPETVKDVFQLDCEVIPDPLFGTPLCIPTGKGRNIGQF